MTDVCNSFSVKATISIFLLSSFVGMWDCVCVCVSVCVCGGGCKGVWVCLCVGACV